MPEIREIAFFCIGRAVMFGSVAVLFIMLAFSFHLVWAFKAGAISMLIMAAILVWRAQTVFGQKPESTEVWLYVEESKRSNILKARTGFASEIQAVYVGFARVTFLIACAMFIIAFCLSAMGVEPYRFTPHGRDL